MSGGDRAEGGKTLKEKPFRKQGGERMVPVANGKQGSGAQNKKGPKKGKDPAKKPGNELEKTQRGIVCDCQLNQTAARRRREGKKKCQVGWEEGRPFS